MAMVPDLVVVVPGVADQGDAGVGAVRHTAVDQAVDVAEVLLEASLVRHRLAALRAALPAVDPVLKGAPLRGLVRVVVLGEVEDRVGGAAGGREVAAVAGAAANGDLPLPLLLMLLRWRHLLLFLLLGLLQYHDRNWTLR